MAQSCVFIKGPSLITTKVLLTHIGLINWIYLIYMSTCCVLTTIVLQISEDTILQNYTK